MDLTALLQQLGFGKYEAAAYTGLLQHGPCNGYELAKATKVPRANVYAVLRKLVQRGAADGFDTETGTHYRATPWRSLLTQLDQRHQSTLAQTREALAALDPPKPATPVVNLDGEHEILTRARAAVDAARDTLLVAIQPAEAAALADNLKAARERGVDITTLCLEACARECGGCQGHIHRLDMRSPDSGRWLLLVTDRATALLAQSGPDSCRGLTTARPLVIELTSAYIRQSLALALLGSELAGRFDGLLSQQARQLLTHLYPDEDFLAHIQSLGQPASS